ncbi:MAG TPA: ATP-dependent 6-phosphofructokinase [Deltaproteobacteria bacterium]|nr:ATP-dependent 6-phosphofructokinase [Deltaproteobacteria bacterium]
MAQKIGICTGGGDAPGLNAVIRAFVKHGVRHHDWEIVGIEDSFNGLLSEPMRLQRLDLQSCKGLLHRGGTVLGTTNRGDPFAFPGEGGALTDRSGQLAAAVESLGLEGIVVVGGDGTQAIALRLMEERGVPVVGVPKTIDNDLSATDLTFGFMSAVEVATEALDRLHTTAESHDRVFFLEVMGRDAGHIALSAGIAGGADVILIPEIPYDPARVADKIQVRQALGRPFSIVVVAEGALPLGSGDDRAERRHRLARAGGAAALAKAQLEGRIQAEMRCCVLGHLQRGGSPVAFDRILATRFGVGAAELVAASRWGEMVCLRDGAITAVPIRRAVTQRLVDPAGQLVHAAAATGVELGAEVLGRSWGLLAASDQNL